MEHIIIAIQFVLTLIGCIVLWVVVSAAAMVLGLTPIVLAGWALLKFWCWL